MTNTLTIALLLSLFALWSLYSVQGVCVRCNGRGRHRDDCPFAETEER
jgi:hypothetical protein